MKKSRKVVILIVEGISDRELFYEYLYERYQPLGIKFKVYNGDIFFTTRSNKQIKSRIGDVINEVIKENKFKYEDILTAIHIMDTDGCFIPETSLIQKPDQDRHTIYENDIISVAKFNQLEYLKNRNNCRKRNVNTMCNINNVIANKVKYHLFYFSRNLEHVLFNEPNAQENKLKEVELFIKELEIDLELFLARLMPKIKNGDFDTLYKNTWIRIKEGNNSLKRETNTSLIFTYLDRLI